MIQKNKEVQVYSMLVNKVDHNKITAHKKKHKLVDKPTALSHMLKKYKTQ